MWDQVLDVCILLGNIVLFTFVTVYLLRDYNEVITAARGLLPERYRGYVGHLLTQIDSQLKAFFRGQLTVCACLGFMYVVGLSIAGTPFALPLGVFGIAKVCAASSSVSASMPPPCPPPATTFRPFTAC
jgi:predicted PurR-regulated permease PerM